MASGVRRRIVGSVVCDICRVRKKFGVRRDVIRPILIFISLYVFFGSGVLLYLYRERVLRSPIWACAALALVLVALPLGGGAIVLPALPDGVCGLSVFPERFPLKHDLS